MAETQRLASPLSLLHEVDTASEVLALTYSFNAAFWERAALSLARQLRAKVTVVSDAAMAVIDPRAVRKAGVTYLDGRAAVHGGGAFHPKLFVIAGPKQAIVAVGSGNLTLSGWSGNAEIWTVLRGSAASFPPRTKSHGGSFDCVSASTASWVISLSWRPATMIAGLIGRNGRRGSTE